MRILACLLLLWASLPASAARLMFIHSYHEGYPWVQDYRQAILENLSEPTKMAELFLDSKRLPRDAYVKRADDAWEAVKRDKPDIIILADDNAISLLSERIATTKTPVVFLGLNTNPRDHGLPTYRQFTGILERPLFKRSLLLVDCLLPGNEAKKLLILSDNSATSRAAFSPISADFKPIKIGKLTIAFTLTNSAEEWKQAVIGAKKAGYQGIFTGLYHTLTTSGGDYLEASETIAWTAEHSPVPHFGFWDFTVGRHANPGGYVLNGYEHGLLAAKLINRLLAGDQASSLGYISDSKGAFRFSLSGVAKWHLSIPKEIAEKADWVE
ncbi:ABC transporter substrate-binding protein [Shewanella halotolerans]|uniref:ABC transporter substrate-binding protein n=1 Tax=Shewanella halotolerans TaxID=2864204 RepID=UPI001C659BE2|nr:hypothetical protein [Shewanella halotolerans]QYJ90214.1 hypothetical protein K0H81_00960 [Shewanella halotolerans]